MAKKKTQIELLRQYFQLGMGLSIAISFALLSFGKYTTLLKDDLYHGIFAIFLFVLTCAWFAGWIYFDHEELEFFEEYIDTDKFKRLNMNPFLNMLFIAIFCGILLAVTDKLYIWIPLAAANLLAGTVGYSQIHYKFINYYYDIKDDKRAPIHEVCEYYLLKPFYLVDTIAIVSLIIGFTLQFKSGENILYLYAAYLLTIITLILHELILWRWRIHRDKKILELEEMTIEDNH